MAAPTYKVHLYNIRTQEIIATVPTNSISYDFEMDMEGAAVVNIPLNAPKANGDRLTPDDLFPCRTGIAIQRGDHLEWGGIVWMYRLDLTTRLIEIGAGGYYSYYKYRHTPIKGKKFTNALTTDIVRWFILEANSGPTTGNGIGTDTSGLTSVGARKSKTWNPLEYETVAAIIEDMADEVASYDPQTFKYGGGFFFHFEPYFSAENRIGHRLSNTESRHPLYNGVTLTQGVNCEFRDISIDGNSMANFALVVGAGNNDTAITPHVEMRNVEFAAQIPTMEVVVSETGEKKSAELRWKARSALAYGSTPIILPTATTYPSLYRPSQFRTGSLTRITTNDGFLDLVNSPYVITKVSVEVATDGNDRLTLDMVQSELFTEVSEEEENG